MSNKYKKILNNIVDPLGYYSDVWTGMLTSDSDLNQGRVNRSVKDVVSGAKNNMITNSKQAVKNAVREFATTGGEVMAEKMGSSMRAGTKKGIVEGVSAAAPIVRNELNKVAPEVGNNLVSGALNNKQLHSWLSRGGGAIAGALLLSAFIKNKPLAILLGGLGGGYLGDYIHKNWKGDWGKTWDGMKKDWGWK